MSRKFAVLAAAMLSVALTATGLAFAQDKKESPLAELMEKIQKDTNSLRKSTRTAPQWKKDAEKVAEDAENLAKLAKDAKKITTAATALKKPVAEWDKLSDDLIKAAGDLSSLAKKKGATQAQAKDAFNAVNKSCSSCHAVFRVEDQN